MVCWAMQFMLWDVKTLTVNILANKTSKTECNIPRRNPNPQHKLEGDGYYANPRSKVR